MKLIYRMDNMSLNQSLKDQDHRLGTRSQLNETQKLETNIRGIKSSKELTFHLLNALTDHLKIDLAVAFRGNTSRPKAFGASNVAEISADSLFMQNLQKSVKTALRDGSKREDFPLKIGTNEAPAPLPFGMFVRFDRFTKRAPLGVLFLKSTPWSEAEKQILLYLSEVYAHAFKAIAKKERHWLNTIAKAAAIGTAVLACVALFVIKVPVSVTAPARVLPKNATSLTAPVSAKIVDVYVTQGQFVRMGDPILAFDNIIAKDQLKLAQQKLTVALSRKNVLSKKALVDPLAREELSVVATEVTLAEIEVETAAHSLEKYMLRAPRNGQVYSDDTNALRETSVNLGDTLLQLIDPKSVFVQADVSAQDGVLAFDTQTARVFLNTDPLRPVPLISTDKPHKPILDERGNVSYPFPLDFPQGEATPRPGVEGTVQLMGRKAALGYVLFRRPINWLRTVIPDV